MLARADKTASQSGGLTSILFRDRNTRGSSSAMLSEGRTLIWRRDQNIRRSSPKAVNSTDFLTKPWQGTDLDSVVPVAGRSRSLLDVTPDATSNDIQLLEEEVRSRRLKLVCGILSGLVAAFGAVFVYLYERASSGDEAIIEPKALASSTDLSMDATTRKRAGVDGPYLDSESELRRTELAVEGAVGPRIARNGRGSQKGVSTEGLPRLIEKKKDVERGKHESQPESVSSDGNSHRSSAPGAQGNSTVVMSESELSARCDEIQCLVEPDKNCCSKYKKSGEVSPSEGAPAGAKNDDSEGIRAGAMGDGSEVSAKSVDSDLPERPSRGDVSSGIGQVKGSVSACASRAPGGGKVTVNIKISPSGTVSSASATGGTAGLNSCVESAVRRAKFPRSQLGASVNYPFIF